jgi:hypothetical protein
MDSVAERPDASKPSDSALSLPWDLPRVRAHVARAASDSPDDTAVTTWDLLPPIPGDQPDEILLAVLTDPHPFWSDYRPISPIGKHDNGTFRGLDRQERCHDPTAQKEFQQAARWGARCRPPWDARRLRRILRLACDKLNAREEACCSGLLTDLPGSGRPGGAGAPLRWLIDGLLLDQCPAMLAAPMKTMKTNLGIAAAVAVAAGLPFLARFPVPGRRHAFYLTGETALAVARDIARRIGDALGVADADDLIAWGERLPRLDSPNDLKALAVALAAVGESGLVITDPLNQMLGDGSRLNLGADMFAASPLLRAANDIITNAGWQWLAIHHCKDLHPSNRPPQLGDVAYTAFAQFFRQWLLVGRRRAYTSDGRHALAAQVGGPGFAGLWAIDIDEGIRDNQPHGWAIQVRPLDEARQQAAEQQDAARAATRQQRAAKLLAALQQLAQDGKPATLSSLRPLTKLNNANLKEAIAAEGDRIETYTAAVPTDNGGRTKETTCYRLRPHPVNSG